ncbi:low temperature requirement protein A [Dysgonomonas sp. GY617]|uniref:low temperature requirement protein A n=1 Tax=Dysgonomonas sp. GY617 TaxID=2780420 RepID=UPI0018834FC7|nr:low temperature requirement protein A [Dysgonomonas sp. GY617]MBF0577365.1 low temperature requirement protein A [Dysgonomonas sp. GY617]
MEERKSHQLLRKRGEHNASVSYSELLFDLIYVFAVTQLSHYLLHHLNFEGVVETTILWFGVWLVWQHTTWVTNWFNPDTRPIRLLLFGVMLVSLMMAASLPKAFGDRGLIFAICYAAIQVGRTLVILSLLGNSHHLTSNFKRILGWSCISGFLWILGGFNEGYFRILLWAMAVLSDYLSPMFGFYLPFLGRSDSGKEWTIDGHHLTERCQLFVIIAFGETILMTGASLSEVEVWSVERIVAALVSFIGSLAMWWIYFDVSSEAATHKIQHSSNPGLLALKYHAVHVILVGAIIICAVGDELVGSEPSATVTYTSLYVLIFGPILYLLANMVFKWITCHSISISHSIAILVLLLLIPVSFFMSILIINSIVVAVFICIAIFEVVAPKVKREELLEKL